MTAGRRRAALLAIRVAACAGCVLHGTDSGVCDFKLDPNYEDPASGWTKQDTKAYRYYHIPKCQRYVRHRAPAREREDAAAPPRGGAATVTRSDDQNGRAARRRRGRRAERRSKTAAAVTRR